MTARLPAFTAEQEAELLRLVKEGASQREAALALGTNRHHVVREAKRLQVSWNRSGATAEAVAQKVATLRERRAAAAAVEMELLEWAQTRVRDVALGNDVWRTVMKGDKGAEYSEELTFIPSRDLKDENAARVASLNVLAKLDTTDPGVMAGISMLEALATSLGVVGPTE